MPEASTRGQDVIKLLQGVKMSLVVTQGEFLIWVRCN